MPSLKDLCRVPALVGILNHPHLKKEIFCSPINERNFEERDVALQKAVSEYLKDFHHVLKKFTPKHLIVFIGFEMWKWAKYQKQHFDLSFKFSENFIERSFFTSKGLIDDEKAARKLLMEPSLSTFLKYSIACHYFLEDVIPEFWQTLPKDKSNFIKMLKDNKSRTPMILWYDYLKEKNTVSELSRKNITLNFKISVFSYGLKEKNIAAVKFSLGSKGGFKKDEAEANIIRKLVYESFCDYVYQILTDDLFFVSDRSFFDTKFLLDTNIILYFIYLLNKRELKEFLVKYNISFRIINLFLLWPYQDQFMDFAHIIFENFSTEKFLEILIQIEFFIEYQCICETYNYHLLFRKFWIMSPPHMKKEIINSESNNTFDYHLIVILSVSRNFTSENLANINLILDYADSVQRHDIFRKQGKEILYNIIVPHGRFDLADLLLNNLNLNQEETLETIKKDFILHSIPDIMEKQDITLLDKIFKWVAGNDDIDDLKEEIFHRLTNSKKIKLLFLDFKEDIPFSFLNKIAKWFLKTDERVEEWKKNIVYSPFYNYYNYKWFDRLLKYQGHSEEEASDFKREFLFRKLPEFARSFLNYSRETMYLSRNVVCLCSDEKEKTEEFTKKLRSYYEDSIKQKMCLICLNNNHVFGDEEEVQLFCENHGTNGFISLNEVDRICSDVSKDLNYGLRNPIRELHRELTHLITNWL